MGSDRGGHAGGMGGHGVRPGGHGVGGAWGQTEFQVNLKLGLTRMAVPEPVSLCIHVTYAETNG